MNMKKILSCAILLCALISVEGAEETAVKTAENALFTVNNLWIMIAAMLVFIMNLGFATVESGLARAKNCTNILFKNLMVPAIGILTFAVCGFGLMYPEGHWAVTGLFGFKAFGLSAPGGSPETFNGAFTYWTMFFFQSMFAATAATIVSGSMAERTNFKAYCIYSAAISLIIYPISGHWIWGGGWLSSLGFHDFAGSTCVHMVGGLIACLGAALLGPRIGKYDKNGKARAIPGHNLTAMALGVFILWFCWFGFNGGSTVAMSTDDDMELASLVMFNTNLAAAVATVVAMIFTWLRYGKPDVSMTFNAALAGLVAITASCDCVTPVGAFFIGLVAGFLVVLSVEFFDNIVKIDDPVGAVSVHMVNGIWGTLAVGLFSNGGDGIAPGLFYGGGLHQLGIQALGVVSVAAYVLIIMFIVFKIIDKTVGLRVPASVEIDGLDMHEHGLASAYSGFAINDITGLDMEVNENTDLGEDNYEKASSAQIGAAVKVSEKKTIVDGVYDTGMHKVSIICRLSRFDALKTALNALGVTGITMTQVMGCGIQKGAGEKYRGAEIDVNLIPKVKVEVVVSKIPVDSVIEAAKKALYTGHIGDGKIFVYNVTRVVKVRTGEEDYAALQDVE